MPVFVHHTILGSRISQRPLNLAKCWPTSWLIRSPGRWTALSKGSPQDHCL